MFARLGRWCHDHRWKVVIIWVVGAFAGSGILYGALGGPENNADFSSPDSESDRGAQLLERAFEGQGAGFGGSIVFEADQGYDDPAVKAEMEKLFAEIDEVDGVVFVGSPYAEGGERNIATKDPYVDKIAFASVDYDPDMDEAEFTKAGEDINKIYDDFEKESTVEGLNVELGGMALAEFEEPTTELLGVAFAIFILILAFGSVLAMGLPIGMALAGIFTGSILAGFFSFLIHPPSFASIFALMIGLGVGIDYALFIVTRYRENLHKGHDIRESTVIAIDTAGRAVIFAGATVVISILGMVFIGLTFVTGMAVAIATVVAMMMVASVTLLPALLGFAGGNVEVTRRRGLIAAAFAAVGLVGAGLEIPALSIGFFFALLVMVIPTALAKITGKPNALMDTVDVRRDKPLRETFAYRWSRAIQHHPWPAALGATVVLLVLAAPVLGLRLMNSDEGNYPDDTTTRQAYELISDGFGPGFNGRIMLVTEVPEGFDEADLEPITQAVDGTEGVDTVGEPVVKNGVAAWEVFPSTSPQEEETEQLVNRLRGDVLPEVTAGTNLDVLTSGSVAMSVDFTDYMASRMPYFFGAVLLLSFLLLMMVFRSILVPLKAVVMNLLSIGAAYGVMVAGFQWGWLGGPLNFEGAPIEPWMPMMLFAVVFGLSMDYEVFLLSRVREEWHRTGDSRTSVADGLAATARVITAAALIMVFVFGAFLLEPDRIVKLMGTGLATAVFLDATIVRMLLVPATMELLGDKNWWLPKWLDRILPNLDVEGHHDEPSQEPERQLEPTS